ncbi:hypothetical protein [Streptomyces sp. NPDC058202]|uniref:hypothetical protein n=1 Tax=Streptomyces sp. NPDC058202 TaxID=3346380 RepID=UPI0036F03795
MDITPFDGNGTTDAPYGADAVTGLTASASLRALDAFGRTNLHGPDVDTVTSEAETLGKVLRLHEMPYEPPSYGAPQQQAYWEEAAHACMRMVTDQVRAVLADVVNASGQTPTVLGDTGTLDERLAQFRAHVRAEKPVVSVSVTGSMSTWLATQDRMAMSLSILTYIPGRPCYSAQVTPDAALLSDCAGSWRMTLADGWRGMDGLPLVVESHPSYVVLPRALEDRAPELRKHYSEPIFARDTSSAIAQAVLGGAVPTAVHMTEHVLNSAIIPVAIGHGMIVVLQDSGEIIEKPWAASKYLFKALKGESECAEGLVVARRLLDARRVLRAVKNATAPEQIDPLTPFDDVDEYDGYDFDGPDHA